MAESLQDKTLNLFFPQWQGSGKPALFKGARLLYQALNNRISFTQVSTASAYSLAVEANILGYSQIVSQLTKACEVIQADNPERVFTLGGDCGVEIAPVSFLNEKYDQTLGVIWLDAHGDLNTPDSSPSRHFHGMSMRVLLGEGDEAVVNRAFSTLQPDQVFLIGAREFDPPETNFIRQNELSVVPAKTINNREHKQLFSTLKRAGFNRLYIHLDLDVIEPEEFPHVACPTPGGIAMDRLRDLLASLGENFDIVGCSILEFLPPISESSAVLKVVELLDSISLHSRSRLCQQRSHPIRSIPRLVQNGEPGSASTIRAMKASG